MNSNSSWRIVHEPILPGDQIAPEEPRRWLLIKREMPVPDPSSGSNRWSVDFLALGDQDATPTFVECKRFNDTRSRREVVGQVLEYAANGHYYWTTKNLREYAEAAAKERGRTLRQMLLGITLTNQDSPEVYFDRMVENMREGQKYGSYSSLKKRRWNSVAWWIF